MSDFSPGFASRHDTAGDALRRAFSAADFLPGEPWRAARVAEAMPGHFEPAVPQSSPREAAAPAHAQPGEFSDPVATAHAAGFAAGRAAALAESAAATARAHDLAERLNQALASGSHFDRDAMALKLRQTVMHLVTRLIGEAAVSPELLEQRIGAATELLADSAESAIVRLNPEDAKLVEGQLPANLFAVGDASLSRGGFVIESASTLIEDGPDHWLEQLAQAIDRVPIPPAC